MNKDIDKWDKRYLDLAEYIAQWSKDPSRKIGSVVVNNYNRIVSVGFNGFPEGVEDLVERYADRETKYKFVMHAERNALDNANVDLHDCTMYVTLHPCHECAKSIIQKGIKRVVSYSPDVDTIGPPFHFEISKKMFSESGVTLVLY